MDLTATGPGPADPSRRLSLSPIIRAMPPQVAEIIEATGRKGAGRFGDGVRCDTDLVFTISGAMAVANGTGVPGVEIFGRGSVYGLENLFQAASPEPLVVVLDASWIAVEASVVSQVTTTRWAERLFAHQALRRLRVLSHDAICARDHLRIGRLASLLLKLHDTSDTSVIGIRQDHLAMILGTARTTVNEKACELQASGAVRVNRGRIRIVDRNRLAAAACCYRKWR